MRLLRSGSRVTALAPAKLNLFFEVLGKRADGYHEIESLMCPIDLFDTLYLADDPSGQVRFECIAAGARPAPVWAADVPGDATNLVVRAVELLRQKTGTRRGVDIRLVKRIPTAAGLGGGSSDAAAALCGLNELWDLGLDQPELAAAAAELGSDVPFFLGDGPALCRGRGECVEPVAGLGRLDFVVVRPAVGLGTAQVYRACRPAAQPQSPGPLLAALRSRSRSAGRLLLNRLEPAAASLSPEMERLRARLARLDLVGYAMSGSGSAWFGICRHAGQARRLARALRAARAGSVFAVSSCC